MDLIWRSSMKNFIKISFLQVIKTHLAASLEDINLWHCHTLMLDFFARQIFANFVNFG